MNIQGEDRSNWEKINELGQGGFGYVCLYRNKITNEHIAIKKLRMREEFSDGSNRVWERWKQEVYIMNKLDHENVIRAIALPPELDTGPEEYPALGMEYCEGGDLRKLLMRPENCCGLREIYIRDLLTGIGSAIEYLHNKRIIHRDIKPENIVLQPTGTNDRFLYKIIDLGYAKELDSSSCCISHVGTQQYLAPELYGKQAYTRTVDYWSFGSVVFECITGKRPFLPDLTSVQWHKEVSQKSPEDITAFYDENGEVKFSKALPESTHLSKPLRAYFEQWLRLMLRWDSKSRGGGVKMVNTNEERPKCFCVLEQILTIKIFHVLFAKANLLLSFPINENHTIEQLQQAIEAMTKIPVARQLLINGNGMSFKSEQLVLDAYVDSSSENPSMFLFCQDIIPDSNVKKSKLPALVELIVKEPQTVLSLQRQKEAWKSVVYFVANENFDCKQLIASEQSAMLALLRIVTTATKQKTSQDDEMKKLLAFREYFQMSLDVDLQQYGAHEKVNETPVYQQWMLQTQDTEKIELLGQHVAELSNCTDNLRKSALELQKKPSVFTKDISKMEDREKDAKMLYEKLKSARAGQESLDHNPMVNVVGKCVVGGDELKKTLHDSIDKMMELFTQVRSVLPKITTLDVRIRDMKQKLVIMQRLRQEDVWKLATHTLGVQNLNLTADTSMSSHTNDVAFNLMSLPNQLESIKLVDNSKTNIKKMDDMLEAMRKDHDESMNYFSAVDN